jgi:hypothetical protein
MGGLNRSSARQSAPRILCPADPGPRPVKREHTAPPRPGWTTRALPHPTRSRSGSCRTIWIHQGAIRNPGRCCTSRRTAGNAGGRRHRQPQKTLILRIHPGGRGCVTPSRIEVIYLQGVDPDILIYNVPVEPPPDSAPLAASRLTCASDGTHFRCDITPTLQLENQGQAAAAAWMLH